MRLIPRHRNRHQPKLPRIAITQDEITADLLYRGSAHSGHPARLTAPRGSR